MSVVSSIRIKLSKNDEILLSKRVEEFTSTYRFVKLYDYNKMYQDTLKLYKCIGKLCKKIREEIALGHSVNLLDKYVSEYYLKVTHESDTWCSKYDSELVGLIVTNVVQLKFRHDGTNETFILWVSGAELK